MKSKVFFDMTNEELNIKLNALKQESLTLRFKKAANQLENANQVNLIKKDIARVKTIIQQRKLNISQEPIKAASKKSAKKAK